MSVDYETERREENLGRAVFYIMYIARALSIILIVGVPAAIVLHLIGKPFYFGFLIGLGAWLLYRGVRVFIFRVIMKFTRWANSE